MKKGSELSVLEALLRLTDRDHFVTLSQISSYIKKEFDYEIERRTLYSDIEILKMHGWVVTGYTADHPGYSIDKRNLTPKEAANTFLATARSTGDKVNLSGLLHALSYDFSNYQKDVLKDLLEDTGYLSKEDLAYLTIER